MNRLRAAELVERDVLHALKPAQRIPLGLAVTDVIDGRAASRRRLFLASPNPLSEISGASGRFMPTT